MSDYGNVYFNVGCPGMISDSSDYNIDGACVAKGDIPFGAAVEVVEIVEGVKVVQALTASGTPYGIVMRSQYEHLFGEVKDGDPLNVVSHGRIWTLTELEDAPTLFAKLEFGEGGVVTGSAGSAGWSFAGGFIKYADVFLIEVQVLQGGFIVPPAPVLVSGATITSDLASPQPNDQVVQFSVAVTPSNAADKTGAWSVDKPAIATIDQSGKLTPAGGASVGAVVVTWKANDAGGFAKTSNFTFEAVAP